LHRWVGLIDPTNGKDKGLQGYLRLSVSVLGPGDKLYVPDDNSVSASEAEGNTDAAAAGGAGAAPSAGAGGGGLRTETLTGSLLSLTKGKKRAVEMQAVKADGELADADEASFAESLVLMPPTLQRGTKWLVVQCYGADGLPAMDDEVLGGVLGVEGIDAYAEVRFAGNPPARTQWITRKGHANLKVEWNKELWIPFQTPSFTSRIEVAVYDFDRFATNDRVGESLNGRGGAGCAQSVTCIVPAVAARQARLCSTCAIWRPAAWTSRGTPSTVRRLAAVASRWRIWPIASTRTE